MALLIDIFYDFTCQDLPPAIEDAHAEFFAPGTGWFHAFLNWDPVELRGDVGLFQRFLKMMSLMKVLAR